VPAPYETVNIAAAGVNDQIVSYIAAIHSDDEPSQAQGVTTPDSECCNADRSAMRDAHTRNASDRIAEPRRTQGLSVT
jgi:hypothetical protein